MEETTKKNTLQVYYEKNPQYRSIHVDGLIGGLAPTGTVNLNFYATRKPIPKSMLHEVSAEGTINPRGELSEDSKIGIIHEIEIGIYMNKRTAKEIYDFLKKILEPNGI